MITALPAVRVAGLDKRYRDGTVALRGVSFEVKAGAIFALLGRNGSGKTTTVRILTGLTAPSGGTAEVLGHDITAEPHAVMPRIGVTLQDAAIDEILTGREFLRLVGSIVGLDRRSAAARAGALLELFGLTGSADRRIGTYSGGMRRRVDLAAALVRTPELLFLDEPTSGLDPQNRRALWAEIGRLRTVGTTIFLTTQYLEEAEALADVIAVVDDGHMLDISGPDELRRQHGRIRLRLHLQPDARGALATLAPVDVDTEPDGWSTLAFDDPVDAVAFLSTLRAHDVAPEDFEIRRDSLEDVFLRLTSRRADAADASR